MTFRRVAISGLGPVSGLGLDIEENWAGWRRARRRSGRSRAFDASGFACRLAARSARSRSRDFVPKSYRKATKVMARDIELAVIAADGAARDARAGDQGDAIPTTSRRTPLARVGATSARG